MHLVQLEMPVLHIMAFSASFEGNWFYLLLIFLYTSSLPPTLRLRLFFKSDPDFFNSTQLLPRTLHCYKGTAEERNKYRMILHGAEVNGVESRTRQPDSRP